ncbi:MAG: hypothetical protein NC079_00655 [Clostridium sp.]|nr:hypothetical protein [Acetatifactor muris]MCM1527453.1 hypothetical protein [Bacteroides sp.]MCM1562101.1 hypothetical protein [Clostridium sp.]
MARPIISKINPFDANNSFEISISWTGSRAQTNRIIISDNDTNQVVWDDTVSSYTLRHTVPAYTLTNNRQYIIQAQIYDAENIPSALSDKVLFRTFATPEFRFDNPGDDPVISNPSFTATVHYYSEDWEKISKYVFYLYDMSKKQLAASDELTDDRDISYTYRGLDNNTFYYIRCVGMTVNGMELDTGYVEIQVKYENPNTYARIYATPLPSQGCIQVSGNLIVIQYNGTDSFEYTDGMIDLRNRTLYYDKGFVIPDDFTVLIRGTNLWQTAELFKMKNGGQGPVLSSRIYTNGKLRFRLLVPVGASRYLLYSDEMLFDNSDMVSIILRHRGNVWQLNAFVGGD